jgi:hypothetical protein
VTSHSSFASNPHPAGAERVDRRHLAGIPVRNGLFECDLERMECAPCYWEGGTQRLVRGTWYVRALACPAQLGWNDNASALRSHGKHCLHLRMQSKPWRC